LQILAKIAVAINVSIQEGFMYSYIDIILDFFIRNFPSLKAIAIGGPIALS